jgi:hypothetical protein
MVYDDRIQKVLRRTDEEYAVVNSNMALAKGYLARLNTADSDEVCVLNIGEYRESLRED